MQASGERTEKEVESLAGKQPLMMMPVNLSLLVKKITLNNHLQEEERRGWWTRHRNIPYMICPTLTTNLPCPRWKLVKGQEEGEKTLTKKNIWKQGCKKKDKKNQKQTRKI